MIDNEGHNDDGGQSFYCNNKTHSSLDITLCRVDSQPCQSSATTKISFHMPWFDKVRWCCPHVCCCNTM